MSTDATKGAAAAPAVTTTVTEISPEAALLQKILAQNSQDIFKASKLDREGVDPDQKTYQLNLVGKLVEEVMKGAVTVSKDTEAMLNARIAQIDEILSAQLNAIMHDPEFQKLEASWRGLHYVVDKTETDDKLQIRVLNASKKELLRDLERAKEFDQSVLFKKIYTNEYDVFGGTPYGAVIGDYEFGKHPQDISLLKRISQVAAAAHAPFISAASAGLFGLDNFEEITNQRDLGEIFRTRDYDKWKAFRESEDSRYVGLCLPHILMRVPYGPETVPVDAFNFKEAVDGRDSSKYLWGNAAYAMAVRITEAFSLYGWCASIRGVENGGLVQDLPLHTFTTDRGDIAAKCPTEVLIPERMEYQLANLGFMGLIHCKNTDFAAFFSGQSCQKPQEYVDDKANANARLSTQLPYILMTSRFAHYLKAIARDKIGAFMSRADCERWLNQWIMNYVTEDDTAGPDVKRQFPLRDARIDVEDDPRRPGCYRAVAYLRPHYMLDELTVSLRLVSELPPARGGK
jgi:type VI secretion system protein ImpC